MVSPTVLRVYEDANMALILELVRDAEIAKSYAEACVANPLGGPTHLRDEWIARVRVKKAMFDAEAARLRRMRVW